MTEQQKKQETDDRGTAYVAASQESSRRLPQFVDMGTVESMTHGSRENTSDEPDSGYKGG